MYVTTLIARGPAFVHLLGYDHSRPPAVFSGDSFVRATSPDCDAVFFEQPGTIIKNPARTTTNTTIHLFIELDPFCVLSSDCENLFQYSRHCHNINSMDTALNALSSSAAHSDNSAGDFFLASLLKSS